MSEHQRGVIAGLEMALAIVRRRKEHYECYRAGRFGNGCESMTTHPATFATLDEVSVFVAAELSRQQRDEPA